MKLLTNAFKLMDTHGIPLTLQIGVVKSRGQAISIPHFYRDALAAGWKSETALARIREAMLDAGESERRVEVSMEWLRAHRELPAESA